MFGGRMNRLGGFLIFAAVFSGAGPALADRVAAPTHLGDTFVSQYADAIGTITADYVGGAGSLLKLATLQQWSIGEVPKATVQMKMADRAGGSGDLLNL